MASAAPGAYQPAGFFVLRTPSLPVASFHDWSRGLAAPAVNDRGELATAVAADEAVLRARLGEIVAEPSVSEALFVASPSLFQGLRYWRRDPDGKRGRRVERSLVAYFGRMTARATPFGLFSGCAMGTIGGGDVLALDSRARHRRVTRIDKAYLIALCESLRHDKSLREALTYRPNDSLYLQGSRYRYACPALDRSGLSHVLMELESTVYLAAVISRAAAGASLQELSRGLVADDEEGQVTREDADAFLHELIDRHVLVSSLTPTVTGAEPADEIVAQLTQLASQSTAAARLAGLLRTAQERLAAIDQGGTGAPPAAYDGVLPTESELSSIVGVNRLKSWPNNRLLQVDLLTAKESLTLSRATADRLLSGALLLHRVGARGRHRDLERFRHAFVARYQGREVPLLEALDEDSGIGFGRLKNVQGEAAPILQQLPFPVEEDPAPSWTDRERHLLRRLCDALMAGERTIELSAIDLERLAVEEPLPLPDAFSVTATLVGSPQDLVSGNCLIHLHAVGGPSGARLIGRFCHVHEEMRDAVVDYLRAEERCRPDVLFAEIVHLAQGRAANIVCRPVLREYELTFLGRSGAPEQRQIAAADVSVSVRGGRVVLRSRRHDREIVPRLTSAHTTIQGLGVYQFLLALQGQDCSPGAFWNWGPLGEAPFLPRIVSGKTILSLAQWRLTREQVRPLESMTPADRSAALTELRRRLGLPRVVAVASADEFVPLDLENVLCAETFVALAATHDATVVREMLVSPEHLCVIAPEGNLAHELIVPFVGCRREGASTAPAASAVPHPRATGPLQRRFGPGSSWLEARVYCGPAAADRLLLELIAPLAELGSARCCFFTRHEEAAGFSLRVSFAGERQAMGEELRPALESRAARFLEAGDISRFALDTYERDVEGFGGPDAIDDAESLSSVDSATVLQSLRFLDAPDADNLRWALTLRGVDVILDGFGFDLPTKLQISQQVRAESLAGFGSGERLRHSLGEKYRAERGEVAALFRPPQQHPTLAAPLSLLQERGDQLQSVSGRLRRLGEEGRLTRPLEELAARFARLHVNRMILRGLRPQELVIFDFLCCWYTGSLARAGEPSSPPGGAGGSGS